MDKVITYNLSDNFIVNLAVFIEKNYIVRGRDISKLAIVFGGKRPSLFLKKELSRRIKKGFFPPSFFNIDEFIEFVLNKKAPFSRIGDLDASYLIYKLAKKISPDILKSWPGFSQFIPWSREILSFIEQLDLEGIGDVSLKNVELKAGIGYDVPENINSLLKDIIHLRQAFHGHLRQNNIYSRGLVYLTVSQLISKIEFPEFEEIIFAGFFYLHKTESAILKAVYQQNKALFFFQGSAREYSVLDNLSQELSIKIDPEKESPSEYNLQIFAGFNQHSQVGLVREIVKKIKDPDKTVILLPQPESVIPLLSEISSCVRDFNVSIGYPLKRSSLYALFNDIFKAQETKKNSSYYAKDYLLALAHPLVKNLMLIGNNPAVTRVMVHKVEEALTGIEKTELAGSLFIKISDVETCRELFDLCLATMKKMDIEVTRDEIKQALKQLHQLLFLNWEGLENLGFFADNLNNFLKILIQKSLLSNYPLNLKMAQKVQEIIEEFQNASFGKEAFAPEEIFKIFNNKLENEMVSFSGSPLKGLQVLGLFETRSLNFENVIVLDANESVLPKLKIYEPLIPREIMISLGLNRLEKEEEIQRYQFQRLISSAKNVYLVYCQSNKNEKSRFIEELIWEKQKKENRLEVISIPKASFQVRVLPKHSEIAKDVRIINFLKKMRYSASSMDTYLNCPLQFYYRYVLGLEEKEDSLQEPEAKDVGNFLHELLEEAFIKFINKKPVLNDKFKKDFFILFEDKFQREFQKKMRSDSFLIKEVLEFRLKRFLENESKRGVKQVLSLEKTLEDKFEFLGQEFKFKARIDRIDNLSDNTILVVDYKTGSTDLLPDEAGKIEAAGFSRKSLQERLKSFQLPLYLSLIEKLYPGKRLNACLYNLREFKDNFGLHMLFKKEEHFSDKARITGIYQKAMEGLFKDLLDPAVPFKADDSDPRHCEYCQFFYLCR
ncbi:MAG: PD-(D/E)XK nuclease family protein [Candidatus Omnitrophica bacterium]|nr:PD-(D/E)XK nuclease family protein [Candidatus Omnitrophota bacterium]